jgi:4-amino-4-deoxy-L-arabinose transferase-like glycosyltransferase
MQLKVHHYLYLFVSFLFLGIVGFNLFADGMFMDGLLYAAVSENMANGSGSFWSPHLSDSLMSSFYEHPPLALGLQSIWFKLFGSSFLIERLYSLFTWVLIGYLIVLIWEQITKDKKSGWIPLLLLTTIEVVTWSAANNMLENTMTIFVCLAVYSYLKNKNKDQIKWMVIAGISISLGFLTKGFFCLYLWSIPFFAWCFKYKTNFKKMTIESFTLVGSTLLPIALLYFLVPAAQINLTNYINHQVLGSIESVQTVDSRFAILGEFIRNAAIPVGILLLVIFISKRKKWTRTPGDLDHKRIVYVFSAVIVSGIIPIMISLKQRGFYIITVYPIFAIVIGLVLYPYIKSKWTKIELSPSKFKIVKAITILIAIASVTICLVRSNGISRDQDIIEDLKLVVSETGTNLTIDICPEMRPYWNLHGYYSRYADITLDFNPQTYQRYYLTNGKCIPPDTKELKYQLIELDTKTFKLYKVSGF